MKIDIVRIGDPDNTTAEGFALRQTCILRYAPGCADEAYYLAQVVTSPIKGAGAVRVGVAVIGRFVYKDNESGFGADLEVHHDVSPLAGGPCLGDTLLKDDSDVRGLVFSILQARAGRLDTSPVPIKRVRRRRPRSSGASARP